MAIIRALFSRSKRKNSRNYKSHKESRVSERTAPTSYLPVSTNNYLQIREPT